MTPEQINIAIAESQGWKLGEMEEPSGSKWQAWIDQEGKLQVDIPNYCNDLNAMHEAWCSLTEKQHQTFRRELQITVAFAKEDNIPHKGPCHSVCNATALQRAEAYLRTIGKWKDE